METKCHEQPSPHCSQLCLMASPACGHLIMLVSDSYRWESLLHISCTNINFINVLCWKKKTATASVLFAKFLDLQAQWKYFRIYSLHRTAIVLLIIGVVCVCMFKRIILSFKNIFSIHMNTCFAKGGISEQHIISG